MTTMSYHEGHEKKDKLRKRILRNLTFRHCMSAAELLIRLGETEALIQAELEFMVLRGDIERLRPVGYVKNDLDAYAIPRPGGYPWDN